MGEPMKWDEKVGVCIKSMDMTVQYQNQNCEKICGKKQEGTVCREGCMTAYAVGTAQTPFTEGIHNFVSLKIGQDNIDAVVINDGARLITLSYPLNDVHQKQMQFFKEKGLTETELKVMDHVVNGFSNSEIADKLFISKSTLRKHLNNIYKKLPKNINLRKVRTQI